MQIHPPLRCALLSLLFGGAAHAQSLAKIDPEHGCPLALTEGAKQLAGLSTAEIAKRGNCRDFWDSDYWRQANFKDRSPSIIQAQARCERFFTVAHRLQNVMCSYQNDVSAFSKRAVSLAAQSEAGQTNRAQGIEAQMLKETLQLHGEYKTAMQALRQQIHTVYREYWQALNLIGAEGAQHEGQEWTYCTSGALDSKIPGRIELALSMISGANASETYNSMALVYATQYLKVFDLLSKEAEAKKFIAALKEQNAGEFNPGKTGLLQVEPGEPPVQNAQEPNVEVEAVAKSAVQQVLTDFMKKYFPSVGGVGASVIGGGLIVIYDFVSNKRILIPETAATFVGMIHPVAGVAANLLVAANHKANRVHEEYKKFVGASLHKNLYMSPIDLVEQWAIYKKNEGCLSRIRARRACIAKNPNPKAYDHSCNR